MTTIERPRAESLHVKSLGRRWAHSSLLLLACTACDDATKRISEPLNSSLACADFAYCSTYDVHVYPGQVPAPAGGNIANGVYRRAWQVEPEGASGLTQADAMAIMIADGSYVGGVIGSRGTLTANGTHLTLNAAASCHLGEDLGPASFREEYEFTADRDHLYLFSEYSSSDGSSFVNMDVWVRTNRVCETVTAVPEAPGDSYTCNVVNCICSEGQGSPIAECSAL